MPDANWLAEFLISTRLAVADLVFFFATTKGGVFAMSATGKMTSKTVASKFFIVRTFWLTDLTPKSSWEIGPGFIAQVPTGLVRALQHLPKIAVTCTVMQLST